MNRERKRDKRMGNGYNAAMKQYMVDAFTDKVFHGNQAAVCVMDEWLADELMLDIAKENHFSETAFTVKEGERYRLRWFTPGGEIDLCGHATLATAFVILNYVEPSLSKVAFTTKSGILTVTRSDGRYAMDFPAYQLKQVPVTDLMEETLGIRPLEAWMGRDLLCVLPSEDDVRKYTPDMHKALTLDGLLLHTTARGSDGFDCVSRSFGPKLSVPEDPVCGSGHCHIAPYWMQRLGKDTLTAYQASERGGTLYCTKAGDRLILAGNAVLFAKSDIAAL